MDIRSARLRLVVAGLAATLVIGFASVASPAYAMRAAGTMRAQCDPTVALSVEATAVYDSAYGRFLDGIISNDSTVTVEGPVVQIGWAEDAERVDYVWPRGDALEPGQWTAFHLCWPDDVPAGWTPIVSAGGHQTDRTSLRLRVDAISEAAVNDETGMRSYVATVTNDAAFPVSSIELVGVEWDGDTFVDATFSWCEPESLAPGESAQIEFHAKAPAAGSLTPEIFVEARKQPVITLSADTLTPYYGSPITFTLRLTDHEGNPLVGCRTLKLFYSEDGECWKYVPKQTETGVAVIKFTPDRPLYFKALYWGDGEWGMAESAVVHSVPKVAKETPEAPAKATVGHSFKVFGRMSAGAKSAGKPVCVRYYRYSSAHGHYVYVGTAKVTPDAAGRFTRSLKLTRAGSWRIRAYRYGVGNSKYEYLKVRY